MVAFRPSHAGAAEDALRLRCSRWRTFQFRQLNSLAAQPAPAPDAAQFLPGRTEFEEVMMDVGRPLQVQDEGKWF